MKLAFAQDGVLSEGTEGSAVEHEPQVLRARMLAPYLQTMRKRHGQAYAVALRKLVQAILKFGAIWVHGAPHCCLRDYRPKTQKITAAAIKKIGIRKAGRKRDAGIL